MIYEKNKKENRKNFQIETDKIIKELKGRKPRLLLHACCAPCSSASLEYLAEYFCTDVFFYNPNISDNGEFSKRLSELERFVTEAPFAADIKVTASEYRHSEFLEAAAGLETVPEGGARCEKCFMLRLEKTAEQAKKLGYEYFATTLTISPLKNPDIINACGEKAAENAELLYLPTDLKKRGRYQRSIELSKEYCLYRQNYCGCEFSKAAAQKISSKEKE